MPNRLIRRLIPPGHSKAALTGARLSAYAVGLSALWNSINTILLPDRVDATAPEALRGTALGLIGLIGIGLATVVQPIAGRVSDGLPLRDRRRPYIIAGSIVVLPFVVLFGWAPTFAWLLVAYIAMQAILNVAQAAFQALIPDLVKERETGVASGAKNALTVLGTAIGIVGARLLQQGLNMAAALAFLAALLLLCAFLTEEWVPPVPPPKEQAKQRPSLGLLLHLLDPRELSHSFAQTVREHPVFRHAVAAQFLVLLGTYPAQRFLLYFLRDRFGESAERNATAGLGVAVLLAALAAAVSGAISDRLGRVPVLRISVWLSGLGLIAVALAPTLPLVLAAGVVLATGLGTFQAVNWALISDEVPDGQGARYFGVANIAVAGSSALAGLFGPLADLFGSLVSGGGYSITFALAGLVALTGLLPLRVIGRDGRIDSSSSQTRRSAKRPTSAR